MTCIWCKQWCIECMNVQDGIFLDSQKKRVKFALLQKNSVLSVEILPLGLIMLALLRKLLRLDPVVGVDVWLGVDIRKVNIRLIEGPDIVIFNW